MADRLVVCLRYGGAAERGNRAFARRADDLCKRAAALGGRITAWHVSSIAFDFAVDGIEDAVELVLGDALPDGFCAGIAQGKLSAVVESSSRVTLALGPALLRASVLARMAAPGEVLLHSRMDAVRSRELLALRARVRRVNGKRVRAFVLDARYPFRAHVESSSSRLNEPAWADDGFLSELLRRLEPKQLGVISADPGTGGTRALFELKTRARLPALFVAPADTGEPLGALRVAILRADLENPRRGALPEPLHASWEALLAGKGLRLGASAELIGASVGNGGLVLIDDAGDIDSDSLEALAAAVEQYGLRAVARIAISDLLPAALSELPRGAEPILRPLEAGPKRALAAAFCQERWPEELAAKVAGRADGCPLAVREALAVALDSGELIWTDEGCTVRIARRSPGEQTPGYWLSKRLDLLRERPRRVLELLALLGGRATASELSQLLDERDTPTRELSTLFSELESRHWLRRTPHDLLLSSRTARHVLLASLDDERRALGHLALARLLEGSGRPLSLASAALHALLGGEREHALQLARRAALAAGSVGLVATASAISYFAGRTERGVLARRGLCGPFTWESPPSLRPPPPEAEEVDEAELLDDMDEAEPESEPVITPQRARTPVPAAAMLSSKPPQPPGMVAALRTGRKDSEPSRAAVAAQALKDRDWEGVERMVEELRADPENSLAADRLEAMAELSRGETARALRLLRQVKDRALGADASTRSRAALALGVALASAGRTSEALLEALEALARARESHDLSGERACATFLAQISEQAGYADAAGAWATLAHADGAAAEI
jgi:hypothetical protein